MENNENEIRDRELENIVGNLMIAEYQVTKLRDRLVDKIGNRLLHKARKGVSAYMFKSNNKWIKISINIEEWPSIDMMTIKNMAGHRLHKEKTSATDK